MSTILLVDDNRDFLEVTQEVLEMEGYAVVTAENGAIALSLIQHSIPDLIISDNDMPVMTGVELLQTLKGDLQLQHIPFMLVTGRADFVDIAYKMGAATVLIKPVMIDQLLPWLRRLLT